MSKKIGILTYHGSINYGAFLQAFSLSKVLKKDSGLDVELINFTSWKVTVFYFLKVLASFGKKRFIMNLKQYIAFKRAKVLLPLSGKVHQRKYSEQCAYLDQHYSILVIGSDEILTAGRTRMRPFPNIYWPDDRVRIPKMVYAGSANRSDYRKLSVQDFGIVKSILQSYNYIGVRDEYTFDQIKYIDPGLMPRMNCDPTFLYDFNAEHASIRDHLFIKFKKITKKPILALMSKNKRIGNVLREHFSNEYFIMAMYYPNEAADFFISDLTPIEWAVGFSLYSGCVSQLFHATVFSIKNRLPFISIDNNPQYDGRSSKISDLLRKADLRENYFNMRSSSYSDEVLVAQLQHNLVSPQRSKMEAAALGQASLYADFLEHLKNELKV